MANFNTHAQRAWVDEGRRYPVIDGLDSAIENLGTIAQDIDEEVYKSHEPLINFLLLARKNEKTTFSPTFVWNEKGERPQDTYTTWALGVGTKLIGVSTAAVFPVSETNLEYYIRPNMTFSVQSPDFSPVNGKGTFDIRVTGVDRAANTFTAVLADPGQADITLNPVNKHRMRFTASQFADATGAPAGVHTLGTQLMNVTQIIKEAVSEDGVMQSLKFINNEDRFEYQKLETLRQLMLDWQTAILMNTAYDVSRTDKQRRMAGLNEFITSNRFAITGQLNEGHIESIMALAFMRHDRMRQKWCMTTSWGIQALREALGDKLILTNRIDQKMGLKYKTWETPYGDINMLVNDYYSTLNWQVSDGMVGDSSWNGKFMILMDEGRFRSVVLNNRQLKWLNKVQANDVDERIDMLIGEYSCRYTNEETAALICFQKAGTIESLDQFSYGTGNYGNQSDHFVTSS